MWINMKRLPLSPILTYGREKHKGGLFDFIVKG
nr:MAG TPA: hypothetical protein [Caudoviricetes sp.]